MKKNFRLFFDMDDTLADFESVGEKKLDKMYEEGCFENLKPLPFLEEVNRIASLCPENIYVLSACLDTPYCKEEKIRWLKKYLPAAMKENVFFSKVGKSKPNYVKWRFHKIDKYDILIDDYSKNIAEWEAAGGTAIKIKNSFNTADPSKYKHVIKDFSELIMVLEKIREEFDD